MYFLIYRTFNHSSVVAKRRLVVFLQVSMSYNRVLLNYCLRHLIIITSQVHLDKTIEELYESINTRNDERQQTSFPWSFMISKPPTSTQTYPQ